MRKLLTGLALVLLLGVVGAMTAQAHRDRRAHGKAKGQVHQVTVPAADRFTPFALAIHAGDAVRWVNNDEDEHFVVSDDAFNTTDNRGTDEELPVDGKVVLRFRHPGTFVYYCKLHAKLDAFNQPVAPGPDGGIEDAGGNFGTPMSGVVTVLPRGHR
jgi:plastocyanin